MREQILDLVFDELDRKAQLRLLAQIDGCPVCQALHQTMTETLVAFDRFDQAIETNLPETEPWPGYAKLRAELIQNHQPTLWQRVIGFFAGLRLAPVAPRWSLTAAGGLLLLTLALGWWLSVRREAQAPMGNPVAHQTPEPEKKPQSQEQISPVVPQPEKKLTGQKPYLAGAVKPRHPRPTAQPDERNQGQAGTAAVAMTSPSMPIAGPLSGRQMSRHFEKAELLLRAFRNAEPSENATTVELADERQRSRRLFYQNVVLRREAETAEDASVKHLLSSLEPLLLDIANLPDQPSSAEVRTIQERIERREMVAVLQVYSALTAPSEPLRK